MLAVALLTIFRLNAATRLYSAKTNSVTHQ